MKVAFPSNGKVISEHFGHCTSFKVFEIDENKKVVQQFTIENHGEHQPGVLPNMLKEKGINVVIAGGIGQKAVQFFNDMGIKIISGASGLIEENLEQFLNGLLEDGGQICSH